MNLKKLIFISVLFCALFTTLPALPHELLEQPLQQDPAILSGQLPNGFTYYIQHNPNPSHLAELRLYVDVGSVDEDDDQRGLAHFTEHMVFNGTKNFAKSELVNYLSSIGMGYANGLNAMTSYDYTIYTFKIPTDDKEKLNKGLMILSDMAYQATFDPAEIEKERGVIIEEWRMGQDAESRIRDKQNSVILAGSRYAERSPIGTFEVISSFTRDTLLRFYTDWYRPDLQKLVIVGDFDPQEILALVNQYFGVIPKPVSPRPKQEFKVPENLTPVAVVATDPEYPYNMLNVMWKKEPSPVQTYGSYLRYLKNSLFFTMLNSRLDEFSKTPNPPYSFAAAYEYPMLRTMSTASIMSMFLPNKAESALTTMLTEAERVQRYGFLDSEFERAKAQILRELQQAVDQKETRESSQIAWELVFNLSYNDVTLSPEQDLELTRSFLTELTLPEINAIVTQLIQEKNMCISIGAPEKEGLTYPSEERLLEIAQHISTQELEAYEDKALSAPLMSHLPKPVKIKKENYDPETGIYYWQLKNGIKIYAKKTDFKNDEVLLSAISPGGYTRYNKEDIPAAELVSSYLKESGFGSFDAVSLSKATADKVVRVSLDVGPYTETLDASCSPKDMELMFQMIYQYTTNPRFNAQDFQSFIQRTKTYYENRNLDPLNVFMDKIDKELYNNHPYRVNLAEVDLDKIEMSTVERIFRDRFADFSDFSFIIVGNFDEKLLKQYCQIYLGNLPTKKRKEQIKDVNIYPISGQKEVRFSKGTTDRAFVSHITNGSYKPNIENDVLMDGLLYVMNEKLRENIREERSGVYFIQAWSDKTPYPKPYYLLNIVMACAPVRVDELNDAIFATLDSLQSNFIDERYIISARETLKQQFKQNIRSNRYWINQLRTNIWLGKPLTEFTNRPQYIDRLTPESIVSAANSYLRFNDNKLSVIMLPENGKKDSKN